MNIIPIHLSCFYLLSEIIFIEFVLLKIKITIEFPYDNYFY